MASFFRRAHLSVGRGLRDFFVSKYPFPKTCLLASPISGDELLKIDLSEIIGGSTLISVADVLRRTSLGITKVATGLECDLDFTAAGFQFILNAVNALAVSSGERIFLFNEGDNWKDMTTNGLASWVPRPLKTGLVELAIMGTGNRLKDRFSVSIWRVDEDALECTNPRAPIKRKRISLGVPALPYTSKIEPIDIVYTWVNADDPQWQELINGHREPQHLDLDRFAQVDELKYSLRSVFAFAPWVRKVFIFSNCAPPSWFVASERVQWVMHDEVIEGRYLPLFSSHSIELFLHRIPGLSERYVYFNDDVFLSGFVRPQDFFTSLGHSISRMEPHGALPFLEQQVEQGLAEEWQSAAVNCARLFQRWNGLYPIYLHRHTPHAFTRSTYQTMMDEFPDEVETTRLAKFRSSGDFSFTSFFYHHFAFAIGKGIHIDEEGAIVRATNYKRFLDRKTYNRLRFFCVNDGGGSSADLNFAKFKETFLKKRFPFKSLAEK
jgi:hypothetical protein